MIVKEYRIKNNLTQKELASLVNVTRSQVSKIETGATKPSVGVAQKMGEVLGFDWVKIFTHKGE